MKKQYNAPAAEIAAVLRAHILGTSPTGDITDDGAYEDAMAGHGQFDTEEENDQPLWDRFSPNL